MNARSLRPRRPHCACRQQLVNVKALELVSTLMLQSGVDVEEILGVLRCNLGGAAEGVHVTDSLV